MDVQVLEQTAVEPRLLPESTPLAEAPLAFCLLADRMPGVDVLRGCAVLMVVVFHGMAY